jgi:hypothetical protein
MMCPSAQLEEGGVLSRFRPWWWVGCVAATQLHPVVTVSTALLTALLSSQ